MLVRVLLCLLLAASGLAQCLVDRQELDLPTDDARFGTRISASGNRVAVGYFPANATLGARIFEKVGDSWELYQDVTFGTVPGPALATGLALDGDTLMLGDPTNGQVAVFVDVGGSFGLSQVIVGTGYTGPHPQFGYSVAIEGNRAVIGVPGAEVGPYNSAGQAAIWEFDGTIWSEVTRLSPNTPTIFGGFGSPVDVSAGQVIIGEVSDGISKSAVHEYQLVGSQWTWTATLGDSFPGTHRGWIASLDGSSMAVGFPHVHLYSAGGGVVRVYDSQGSSWSLVDSVGPVDSASTGDFGTAVLLHDDWLVVGEPSVNQQDSQGVHVFHWNPNNSRYAFQAYLDVPVANWSWFGSSLAVADGDLFIGAPRENSGGAYQSGAVYSFQLNPPGTTYCGPANANSTGLPGTMFTKGCATQHDNTLRLVATQLPLNTPAYFVVGTGQGFVTPPGYQGSLCLSGALGRLADPGSNTGGNGRLSKDVDLMNLPSPTGPVSAPIGSVWHFQCWYRDVNPGSTANFTDAMSVLIRY